MVSFLALLDDVAALLDDTAAMTKVAAKKTASILGDDLAVNAEQSSKFSAKREIVAIKKIAIGAVKNKLILLPVIALLGYFLPSFIVGLLIAGGIYLAYEGVHALIELLGFGHEEEEEEMDHEKIKGAIVTDFVLSIEIIVIAFSTVLDKPFVNQMIVVSIVAFAAVFFVYGLVLLIVRLDDMGLWFASKGYEKTGRALINSMKWIVNSLKWIGTVAMFLVAGGIFVHHAEYLHHINEHLNIILSLGFEFIVGTGVGIAAVSIEKVYKVLKENKAVL